MSAKKEKKLILSAVFLAAFSTIANEIIAASSLTHIVGASIFYFSLVIGIYLAALGLGGWLSSKISDSKILNFLVVIEIILSFGSGVLAIFYYFFYGVIFRWLNHQSFFGLGGAVLKIGLAEIVFNLIVLSYLFILGILDGYELPLTSRALSLREDLKKAIGKAFFWDYGGGLIASIFLPILFFPLLGVIGSSFLNGLLTALAGLLFFWAYKGKKSFFKKNIFLLSFLVLALIFNFVFLVFSKPVAKFFQEKIYLNQKIVYLKHSPYQQIVYAKEKNNGKIRLYLDGNLQFEQGIWDKLYHETFAQPAFLLRPKAKNILVLGGGDGILLREIFKHPVEKVTLVDIDREVVNSAKYLNFVKEINKNSFWNKKLKVRIGDAFKFIETNRNKYDLIFIDFPDPTDDSLSRLYSQEFYFLVRKRLKSNGIVVIQSSGYKDPTQLTIIKTLSSYFHTLPYHPPYSSYSQWYFYNFGFTIASLSPINQSMIEKKKIKVPTEILNDSNLKDMFIPSPLPKIFRLGIFKFKPKVNSLFYPNIVKTQGDIFFAKYLESVSPKFIIKKMINIPKVIDLKSD